MEWLFIGLLVFGFLYAIHSHHRQTKRLEARQSKDRFDKEIADGQQRELVTIAVREVITRIDQAKLTSEDKLRLILATMGEAKILSTFGLWETGVELLADIERATEYGSTIDLPGVTLSTEDRNDLGEVRAGAIVLYASGHQWSDIMSRYKSPEAVGRLQSEGLVSVTHAMPTFDRDETKSVRILATITQEGRVVVGLMCRLQFLHVSPRYEDLLRTRVSMLDENLSRYRSVLQEIAEELYAMEHDLDDEVTEGNIRRISLEDCSRYGLAFAHIFENYSRMQVGGLNTRAQLLKELGACKEFSERFG